MLRLATREQSTMTGVEETAFHGHLESCTTCQALATEDQTDWRWLVRIPPDALDDRELLVLPMVDPIVFEASEQQRGLTRHDLLAQLERIGAYLVALRDSSE